MKFKFDETKEWMDAEECSTDWDWDNLDFDWDFDKYEVEITGDEDLIKDFLDAFNLKGGNID